MSLWLATIRQATHLQASEGSEKWSDSEMGKVIDGHNAVILVSFLSQNTIATLAELVRTQHKQEYNIFFRLTLPGGYSVRFRIGMLLTARPLETLQG